MNHFTLRHGELHCEDVALAPLAATLGTPLYVYSKAAIVEAFRAFDRAFAGVPHLVCFAMKANDHLAIRGSSRARAPGSTSSPAASCGKRCAPVRTPGRSSSPASARATPSSRPRSTPAS